MQQLIQYGDYFGTLVFAVTGALAAAEKRLDLGGFFLLAFVTGVGGGTLRDLIIHRGFIFWAEDPTYIVLCLVGAVLTFFAAPRLTRVHAALVWGDALGLALFCVIGAGISWLADADPLVCVLMGVLTATGGGVIREMIRNELPLVLHREIYMSAALAGSVVAVTLAELRAPAWTTVSAGFAAAFALRGAGILFDLHLPRFTGGKPEDSSTT